LTVWKTIGSALKAARRSRPSAPIAVTLEKNEALRSLGIGDNDIPSEIKSKIGGRVQLNQPLVEEHDLPLDGDLKLIRSRD